jgi:prevent-host-death family protein
MKKEHTTTSIGMTEARHQFSEIANRVIYGGQRIFVEKNNKPAFALVSIDDVRLLETLEDNLDLQAAKKALKEGKFRNLKDIEKELGL